MELTDISSTAVQRPTSKCLCCICGLLIDSNPSNMCPNCIRAHVDITEGLIKDYILIYCPECFRYLQPPTYWSRADRDSRELMTICLKKIKGLNKFTLADANFIWTEEHSKRLKLKVVLQKEIFTSTIIQQAVQVDYEVRWAQCPQCAKVATGQPQWDSVVQLRQIVDHMRTLLFLEQVILKHRMHEDATRIESHPQGLDFFFAHRSHAMSFVDFIGGHSPTRRIDAKQLVSHDTKSNTAVNHHAFSIEIAPLCREDLVCLPLKLHQQLGGVGPLVLVHKVFSSIVFLDPKTLRAGELMGTHYWKGAFPPLATTRQLLDFYIIDIERTGSINGKFHLAQATVCLDDEVGQGREWVIHTHLGAVLNPGDLAKGYLLDRINHNNADIELYRQDQFQDVLLVRKHFPNQVHRRHKRTWHVKTLDVLEPESNARNGSQRQRRLDALDEFRDELERNEELRRDVPIYKDTVPSAAAQAAATRKAARAAQTAAHNAASGLEGGDDGASTQADDDEPTIALEELLDELTIAEAPAAAAVALPDEETAVASAAATTKPPPQKRRRGDDDA